MPTHYHEFSVQVTKDAKLVINRQLFRQALRDFAGKAAILRLSEPTRNSKRNRRLHAVLGEVADALGWETEEFKEFIVTKLRPLEVDPVTGFIRRQRTHKMTDREIDELITEIQAWTVEQMPGFTFKQDQEG